MAIHFQHAVELLKKQVLTLGAMVEENVGRAVKAAMSGDENLAMTAIAYDDEIDRMEIIVEEECLKLLALYQPVAIDLRFVVAVLKMNSDLERIGDLAVNIAERAVFLSKSKVVINNEFNFPQMFDKARSMLKKSIDALVESDALLAAAVCNADDEVDAFNRQFYDELKTQVKKDPAKIDVLLHLLTVSRSIERIGDHATNIAEDVIYMVEGQIVRHKTEDFKSDQPVVK